MIFVGLSFSLVLLLAAFWTRAAASAVARVPRADALRDASADTPGAQEVAELLDERQVLAPAVSVVSTALLVLAAAMATASLAPELDGGGSSLAVAGALGLLVVLAGDVAADQLGRLRPRFLAYRSAEMLRVAMRLGRWAAVPRADLDADEPAEEAEVEDDGQERELIDSVLEFSETLVREVMTPRPDMVMIEASAGVDELIGLASGEGYSRLPVTSDGDIVGMVIVKDLLPLMNGDRAPGPVSEVMRPVQFVPETKLVSSLLAEMQDAHAHQVVVVDEYGDVAGLVTIEDLLEELVGEIEDETDLGETLVVTRSDGWEVDARLSVDDLEKVTGVELPREDWDTVGGLVLGLAERVPEEDEVFECETLRLRVTSMQGRRVSSVRVTLAGRVEA